MHLPAAAGLSCCFSILRTGKENLPCFAETGGVAVGVFIGGVNGKRQIGIWPRPPPNLLGIIKSFFFFLLIIVSSLSCFQRRLSKIQSSEEITHEMYLWVICISFPNSVGKNIPYPL